LHHTRYNADSLAGKTTCNVAVRHFIDFTGHSEQQLISWGVNGKWAASEHPEIQQTPDRRKAGVASARPVTPPGTECPGGECCEGGS